MLKVNQDGTATILSGTADMGTGGDTALIQIAAAELGLRYEDVNILIADTDGTEYDFGSVATQSNPRRRQRGEAGRPRRPKPATEPSRRTAPFRC